MVPNFKNWRVILAALLLLAVIGGGIALLANRTPDEDGTPDNPIAAIFEDDDADDGSDSDSDDGSAATTAPLIDTEVTGEVAPPKTSSKKSASTTPAAPGTTPATPATPAVDPWQQYLDDTRAVVTTNTGDMTDVIAAVTAALGSGDQATLAGLLAPDEGAQSAYLSDLAGKYPKILQSRPASTVNIFSAGGTTVYFGYSFVQWTDAGIVSQHTIPIMLRFVSGEWALTTLGDTGSDLQFVQSVML